MAGQIVKIFQFYGYALIQILIEPKRFFTELPDNASLIVSLGFCTVCSLFYTGASLLTGGYDDLSIMGGVFFLGSLGMAFVSSLISYITMILTINRKTGFEMIFSIHAFSSGIILLISWVSFFFWFTEIWKWWLVYTGLRNAGRISAAPACLILFMTVTVHFFLLFYLYPVFFRI
ncbi:MAG: hypothetical protein A2277_17025 [Desulfobacterales bacterium RIFOXYA12_FULL_46_15]|nr:MAG: hypothetical protein A2277_17025 [Desulfobacterales bacterium RIFOXYA12_FULL_46_15]